MKKSILYSAVVMACTIFACCSPKTQNGGKTSDNPSAYLTDQAKIDMVHSLKTIDSDRFLELDYTLDYDLDDMIAYNADSFEKFLQYIGTKMFDVTPSTSIIPSPSSGCSAFATEDPANGDKYMGRNYDYCHVENGEETPITALLVKTAPKNGKKSISMVDTYWMGYKKGFYTDGKSDLSMLMGAPYSLLDGMNEDGLAVGVLHLLGNPAMQDDPAKNTVWSSVLMRIMLDRASTVKEAIELAKKYNMNMVTPAKGNNHFFVADATGDCAIIEYSFDDKEPVTDDSTPNRLVILQGEEYSYVTNFYVDPYLADNDFLGGLSTKGKARYLILKGTLWLNGYQLTPEQSMDLLKATSQKIKPEENTSHTQWSALYNLTRRTMDISILKEYETKYSFSIE